MIHELAAWEIYHIGRGRLNCQSYFLGPQSLGLTKSHAVRKQDRVLVNLMKLTTPTSELRISYIPTNGLFDPLHTWRAFLHFDTPAAGGQLDKRISSGQCMQKIPHCTSNKSVVVQTKCVNTPRCIYFGTVPVSAVHACGVQNPSPD